MNDWPWRLIKLFIWAIGIALATYLTVVAYDIYSIMRAINARESASSAANAEPGCHDVEGSIGSSPGILWASPQRICPGQRFTVGGFGFKPGAMVTLEVPSRGVVGSGAVDDEGLLSAKGGPIDGSFCGADLIAVIDGERESVNARFC